MRIALVAYMQGNGGAERQITLLANALSSFGHEVFFIITGGNDMRYPIASSVKCVDITGCEGKPLAILRRFLALKKALCTIQPDITVHYNFQSAYFAVAMPKKARGRVIYSERGDPYDEEYHGLLGVVRKHAIKRIDGFVFQTEGARDFFDDSIKKRSAVIHNPISINIKWHEIVSLRDKRIVNVGRLHPQKNQRLLIDSFSKISSKFPDYTLEIYGDGALKEELEKQISKKGLNRQVHLLKARKDIFEAIKNAALFVLTSDYEGMPNALMEAMALGIPCISTDCRPGGARALIENGVNGIIVSCGDADALAEKMSFLLENKEIANSYGEKATHIIGTHNPDVIFKEWEEFLERITKKTI